MNKFSTYFSRLAFVAIAGFAMASCTTETTGGGTPGITVDDQVSALSAGPTSIGVKWTRAASDVSADTVTAVSSSGTVAATSVVASPGNTTVLTGLSENVMYTITVKGTAGSSLHPVTWMTAQRSGLIRLWETADNHAGEFSGLQLSTMSAISVSSSSPNRANADVVLARDNTVPNSKVSLVAGSVTTLSGLDAGRNTRFSGAYMIPTVTATGTTGLDNLYFTGDLRNLIAVTGADTTNAYDIPGSNTAGSSAVILMKTADNHFAKVEVVPQPTGLLYGTLGTYQFIDVRVSYQNGVDMPYADRGRQVQLMSGVAKHTLAPAKTVTGPLHF